MAPGRPVRREFKYIRLMAPSAGWASFDVRRGKPFGFTSGVHNSDTFIKLPTSSTRSIRRKRSRIVMDNLSAHDTSEVNEWFDEHPRWTRHFTPKHASRNKLRSRVLVLDLAATYANSHGFRLLRPMNLPRKSTPTLPWYLETDRPFRWSYRPKSWDESAKLRPRGTRAAMRVASAAGAGRGGPRKPAAIVAVLAPGLSITTIRAPVGAFRGGIAAGSGRGSRATTGPNASSSFAATSSGPRELRHHRGKARRIEEFRP